MEEEEGDSLAYFRERWFYGQREFPVDSIPRNAYSNAILDKENINSSYGNLLDIPFRWNNIGPKPILNGWGGYNSGRGAFIQFDNNSANGVVMYMGSGNGGLWKTTDEGDNWLPITDLLGSLSSGAIAIQPGNSNVIYYGTGEPVMYVIYTYTGRGIYKTTNNGESWLQLNGGLPTTGTKVYKIIINPGNTNIVLAAMNTGLWRTSDGGLNWNRVTGNTDLICTDVVFKPDNPQIVYCAGFSTNNGGVGFRKSTDGGITFNFINDLVFQPNFTTKLAVSNNAPDIIYSTTNIPFEAGPNGSKMKIFKSTNGIGTDFSEMTCIGKGFTQVDYDLTMAANPFNENIILLGIMHLFKSTTGGNNLNYIAGYENCIECCATNSWASNMHPDFHGIDFSEQISGKVAVINDGGVWLSPDNGINWYNRNYNLSTTLVYDFDTYKNDKEFLVTGVQDMGFVKKQQNSQSWEMMFAGGDGGKILISKFDNKKMIIVGNLYGDIKQTTNSWSEWSQGSLDIVTKWEPNDGDWVAPLAEHPTLEFVLYTARRNNSSGISVFKSTNSGLNFISISTINGISIPPQDLVICESNPNIMYLSASHFDGQLNIPTELFSSSNGGVVWFAKDIINNGIPKRYITDIQIDPANPNEIYITLSGIGSTGQYGHVFKSVNGGTSWTNISGNLSEYSPVNKFLVYYWGPGQNDKRYIVAADNGVWTSNDLGETWVSVAAGLPNTIYNDLELHELSGYLRASSFGRGMYEINFETPFFVNGDYLLSNNQGEILIERDIHITANNKLSVINNTSLKFTSGKKIIVENGGQINVSSGASVTFTSQSGEWGGIEFQGDSYGTLRNCTFQNTSTPIVIEGDPFGSADPPDITIDSCNFNAPIEITNRKDVTVEYCNFNYSSGSAPSVLGIFSSGSDNALFSNNTINSGSSISSTGISVVYGSGIVIQKNAVNNMTVGISVSNTSPLVSQNRITNGTSSSAIVGIGFDNSYSAAVKQNTVIGYQVGYKLYNSSPEMYMDSSYNTGTSGDSVNGLHAVYLSNPRLKPGESIGGIIWDAGKNNLKTITKGNGVYMYMNSVPILDYGYNHIWGYDNYLFGDGPDASEYYVRCNDWVDDPPNSGKFNLSLPGSVVYSPYGCTPPGGSGYSSNKAGNAPEDDLKDSENPPAFIVVNYGHGIYDTIKVTTGTNNIPADQNIFGEAVNEELTGNFLNAVTKYKNLLLNYQTSNLARNSLKKILNCYVKMNADSNQYSDLRNYYLSLVQQYPNDTAFVKAAKELAAKTLVKKGEYANAITEYENLISGNNDMHEVLCCELNIIETYMIISEQGDAPGFTGNIASLKPLSKKDGYRKIMEKLYGVRTTQNNPVLPVKFSLSQNYPNPFNPLTKINYSLPNATKVHIRVYDLLGRLVKTLVNEFKEAGSYDVQFDGTGLASGVYFYRIEAGDFVDSKKMVLVK